MELQIVLRLLWYVSAIVPVAVLVRIASQGLLGKRPYVAFSAMLAGGIIQDGILLFVGDYRSRSYALAWALTLIPVLLLECWAAVSTYRSIANLYPKIGAFAVRLFQGTLIATAIACCVGLPFETRHITGIEASVRALFLLDRWMNSLMAGGLLLAVACLARYPRPLKVMPANLVLHTALLCAYFSAYSIVPFILNLVPLGSALWVQTTLLACVIGMYATWAVRLSREGEKIVRWPRIDDRILERIDERNLAILQFGATLADSALRQATGRR